MKLDPFGNLHTSPFTKEDIEHIEEVVDSLIREFYRDSDDDDLDYVLGGDLVEKLEGYVAIARHSVTDPELSDLHDDLKIMAKVCEEMLKRVRSYYHSLN